MRRMIVLLVAEAVGLAAVLATRDALAPRGRADDLVVGALWLGALAITAWLLVSTLAWLAVEVLPRVPRSVHRAVAVVTLPAARVVVTRAVLLSMVGSLTMASGTVDGEDAHAPAAVRTGRDPSLVDDADALPDPITTTTSAPAPPPSPPARQSPIPPAEHRVAPDDNLWSIAAAHLRAHVDPGAGDPEIARYWTRVIEANRAHLLSGDPDLIYPGEIVSLPPL